MDINKALKSLITTGKVHIGVLQTKKALRGGKAKLIILANNCPEEHRKALSEQKVVPVFVYGGDNMNLGAACGKPFSVSALAVLDPGESGILALGREKV